MTQDLDAISLEAKTVNKCQRCDGCGKIANSDEGEPWTQWLNLPPGSNAAVVMGIVRPIPCPACHGTGKVAEDD